MSGNAVQFHYAARSDVGLVRSNNQDSGYAGANLLVLADGMGGPAGGDIASSVALAHLVPLDTDSHPADSMLPLLREALLDAHEELTDRSSRDRDLEGLGTTCIALMRSGNRLAMVHIGDSRAYVLRGDTLTQVTTDHSFVQYLVDTGQITPEEAEHHPNRNVVLKILGDAQADVAPDETIREAVVGDRWMLCSDGLSGLVSPETIGQVMADFADPGECAEELIRLALLGGGPDNITCVIADIVPAGTYPPAPPQIVGAAAIDRHAKSRGGEGAAARAASSLAPPGGPPCSSPSSQSSSSPRRGCPGSGPKPSTTRSARTGTSSSTRASPSPSVRGSCRTPSRYPTSRWQTSRPWTASVSTPPCCAPHGPTSTPTSRDFAVPSPTTRP